MTDEMAKAVQEVAKTTRTLAEITGKVGAFVAQIIGPASIQIGGILEDEAKLYRYKNLLCIADKVEAIHAKRKIEDKTIPIHLRTAIPMLESSALEDEETLQDVWARLIANSTDPNFKTAIHPGYIEIIKQMSPDEAIILNSFLKIKQYPILLLNHVSKKYEDSQLYGGWWKFQEEKPSYDGIYEYYLKHCANLQLRYPKDSQVYLDNLQRLQIVELGHDFLGQEPDDIRTALWMQQAGESDKQNSVSVPVRDEYLRMTAFGRSFVEACINENSFDTTHT